MKTAIYLTFILSVVHVSAQSGHLQAKNKNEKKLIV
jgi:hypothetical protein